MTDYTEINRKKIIEYFQSGCKKESSLSVGLELEHFIVDKETGRTIDFYGEHGVERLLRELRIYYEKEQVSNGWLIGLEGPQDALTLEPGAQLEISIIPKESLRDTQQVYQRFYERLSAVLEKWGYEAVEQGYHPVSSIEDISLLPKDRYAHMYHYFENHGTCGKYMMKGTASTQVSIDYKSEEEFRLKFRAAYLFGPVFSLLTANAPVFQGKPSKKRLLRQYIWENVDNSRTAIIPGLFEDSFGFSTYAGYAYEVPQIVMADQDGKGVYTEKSARELYCHKEITQDEIEQVLSMVFPDVRLKKYIEIRVADSLPIEKALSYGAMVKGIFSNRKKLAAYMEELGTPGIREIQMAKESLQQWGFQGKAYGKKAGDMAGELLYMAEGSLGEKEKDYLLPLKNQLEQELKK